MRKSFMIGACTALFLFAAQASAHAVVSPNQANIGEFINFSLGVPSEKPVATVGIKLMLPDGLSYVTPFVKPGWKIEVKQKPEVKDGKPVMTDDGTQAQIVSEIDWTGGSIPADQKDQFMFSAQVPASATTLAWKVYQTYADGSVVSWDQDPNAAQLKDSMGNMDFSKVGPYSATKIINDLVSNNGPVTNPAAPQSATKTNLALGLSVAAVLLALWAAMKKA
jgi:uncharacterized protein YcnI